MRKARWKLLFAVFFLSFEFSDCWGSGKSNGGSFLETELTLNKNNCLYSRTKKVTLFIDDSAEASLSGLNVKFQEILRIVGIRFAMEGMIVNYDLNSLRIKRWDSSLCEYSSVNFDNVYDCLHKEIIPKVREEKHQSDADVIIFLASRGKRGLSGISLIPRQQTKFDGNGVIVLNLNENIRFGDNGLLKPNILRGFSNVLLHEQAHLYGLGHTPDPHSVMYSAPDFFHAIFTRFDDMSVGKLKENLEELELNKRLCTALK